jgi:glycine cleavage system H lipoate-binding protein
MPAMLCPFHRESRAGYCRASDVRKPVPLSAQAEVLGRCLSGRWQDCPALPPHAPAAGGRSDCPYLAVVATQYCSAASRAPYIPYQEPALTRCGPAAYRYCGLYLDNAGVAREEEDGGDELLGRGNLYYAHNHMWIEIAGDGVCHLGIDAFLARLLGAVESVTYLTRQGRHRPSAVFTFSGMSLQIAFPGRVFITGCNAHLRSDPSVIAASPYRRGWMFEGRDPELHGLMSGAAAQLWMREEIRRVAAFMQGRQGGGILDPGFARRLTPNEALLLYSQFSPPPGSEISP